MKRTTTSFQSKTKKAIQLYLSKDLKGALRIFKGFNKQFEPKQLRTLQIAYEVLTGNGKFYKQLGININHEVAESMNIIDKKYDIKF